MAVQILIGTEDGDLAAMLNGQFRELPDTKVLAVETTSNHVAGTVGATPQLDVVLVHQSLGPLPALDLIRDLVIRHPQLAVILIADTADADTFAAAMAAGARGVISTEPTLSELQSRVRQAAEWSRTMRRHFSGAEQPVGGGRLGTLVTLCGAKGGVGTTTLAIHLAVAAANTGRNICLVEMDLQNGDISGYLDIKHRHSVADVAAAAGDLDGAGGAEALYVHPPGPHVLLAPELADHVVIVATPDVPALRAAKRLAKMFARLAIRKEEDATVLLVKQDRRNEIQPELARKMVASPLRPVTIPAVFRALEDAVNTGAPEAIKHSDFRKAVGKLAVDLGIAGESAATAGRSAPA